MAAPDDANLDDLRRRARRRLVGAIVLALAVAVFVPMLLESDPKPLGEDVSVKIPPVDDGKFVSKLGDRTKSDAPRMIAKADPKVEAPKAEAPKAEPPKVEAPKIEAPKMETPKAEPSKTESSKEAPPPKAEAPAVPAPKEEPRKSEPPPVPASTKAEPAKQPVASREPGAGEFSVQVFAFSDDKGANSLVNKLKGKGFPAYTEPVTTSRGTLWRVRVGPFPSREGASAARDKLKGEGYNGIVASAK
jgi:DedD protein